MADGDSLRPTAFASVGVNSSGGASPLVIGVALPLSDFSLSRACTSFDGRSGELLPCDPYDVFLDDEAVMDAEALALVSVMSMENCGGDDVARS